MGLCGSTLTPEEKHSKMVENELQKDHAREKQKVKLLLLGAGESGKSTLFKQMKLIYGVGFSDGDRAAMKPVVHNNAIGAMKVLCDAADEWEVEEEKDKIQQLEEETELTTELGLAIQTLWKDEGIQEIYRHKSWLQLIDSASYFFDAIERISVPSYIPTIQDVLKSRVRTSGIVEEEYRIHGATFMMYDVGGQRNERKKWIHCFDEVTAVIFVASLSEYDQVLYEDNTVNRMEEAVNLFDEICNSRWFRTTSFILFLNKRDLFETKIRNVDLRDTGDEEGSVPRNLDYQHGKCKCEARAPCTCGVQAKATEYIRHQFKSRNTDDSRVVYDHVVCATDTANVKIVFDDVNEMILRQDLLGSSFM